MGEIEAVPGDGWIAVLEAGIKRISLEEKHNIPRENHIPMRHKSWGFCFIWNNTWTYEMIIKEQPR